MNWLTSKYAYPLVILAILTSTGLQMAWLNQLFNVQRMQVKRDLELVAGNAAQMSNYLSVVPGHENSENLRNFFLSPEWLQFKQAFTNMRFNHVGSSFMSDIQGDSTIVNISLRVNNNKYQTQGAKYMHWYGHGKTKENVAANDQRDLKRMDSLIRKEIEKYQLKIDFYHVVYDYDKSKVLPVQITQQINRAAYHSQQYAYNLSFLHTYQLIVPSINSVIFYRMRFYLASSLFMLILTSLAFIFLFRLMKTQRLYSQARIAFTSNMTHELKTPVAIMEVALDAITRYNDPGKLENYLNISRNELHRLNLMIEKVLNLDQLDNGDIKLRQELYDVQQGLEQVVTAMRLHDSYRNTQISYFPADEPCFVNGDPVHLTNVFYNLMDNAIKYSGKESHIRIKCSCDTDNVRISFKDNGIGIAKINHERIFERFFRVQDQIDIHNVKGSGLGLHYVNQIIKRHFGKIRLVSEPGNGSEFIIELPAYHEI